jgi:hypothetical protein
MSSLKGLLFSQYAGEGLNNLIEEMQKKYKPKKGRRFNHNNITYEISRPALKENCIEFEISSKIPEDELENAELTKVYFEKIKKIISKQKVKPTSIEMENIVWDSRKDTEKQREYVKLLYQYPLNQLFDNDTIKKKLEENGGEVRWEKLPKTASTFTQQGKFVLQMVCDTIQDVGREHIDNLVNANKAVRTEIVG